MRVAEISYGETRTNKMNRKTVLPLLCLLVVGFLLGVTANVVKIAVQAGWPPLAFLFWGTLIAGGALLLLAVGRREAPSLRPLDFVYYLICGFLSIAAPNMLGFGAVAHVGASFVALCLALPPLLTYGLALALGMESLRASRAVGVCFGLAGAAVLGAAKASGPVDNLLWIGGALASPIFISMGNIYRTLRWPAGASALSLAPGMLIFGAILTAPSAILVGAPFRPTTLDARALGLLAAQSAVFTLTYALYFVLQKLAGPVYLSQIGSVAAVSGAAIAVAALGEPAGLSLLVAAALILMGVLLVNRRR
jgi:drug/metabolite transporter (DMT)-like permease